MVTDPRHTDHEASSVDDVDCESSAVSKRAWWQFSLRTLFVTLTLFGLLLGWFFAVPEKQRRLIMSLQAQLGDIRFVDNGDTYFWEDWIPAAYFKRVETVALWSYQGDGKQNGLELIGQLSSVRKVYAFGGVEESQLAQLSKQSDLEVVHLNESSITSKGLKYLQSLPRLTKLFLNNTKVVDNDLAGFDAWPQLTVLDLGQTAVTDEGVKLLASLKQLTKLNLEFTEITDVGASHLAKLARLHSLNIQGTRMTGKGLRKLADLASLRSLKIFVNDFATEDIAYLQEKLPELRIEPLEKISWP